MRKLHVVCGLPRAGSTLLCNILNQNPDFLASSTSPLPQFINAMSMVVSQSIEAKNLINEQREVWEPRLRSMMHALMREFYPEDRVVFDKSRAWNNMMGTLIDVSPETKAIVCVRDVKAVLASIEKQNLKTPLYQDGGVDSRLLVKTIEHQISDVGLVGSSVMGVMDLVNRKFGNCLFLKFEYLSSYPEAAMKQVYEFIGEPYFAHDFNDVKNTAIDPDGFYLHKFPHKGEGKVTTPDLMEWQKYIPQELALSIQQHFIRYQTTFSYV